MERGDSFLLELRGSLQIRTAHLLLEHYDTDPEIRWHLRKAMLAESKHPDEIPVFTTNGEKAYSLGTTLLKHAINYQFLNNTLESDRIAAAGLLDLLFELGVANPYE